MKVKRKEMRVPKLRFKEFDGAWSENNLGRLFTFKNGLNSDKEKYGSGIKFINVLDIIGESVITYDSIIGKVEVTQKELTKNEVIYGDVLFQRSSETREEVGQANVYVDENKSAVFGGFVIRGRKKVEYNPYFMNYLLKTSAARKEITTKSGGSTRYNVGQESLTQVCVNLPSLPEQQKIASFLSAVDDKVQHLSKKKELLQEYKKGVMQRIFKSPLSRGDLGVCDNSTSSTKKHTPGPSQEGRIRFKQENGEAYPDWEEKRLGDISNITIGEFVIKTKQNPNGAYPVFNGGKACTGYYDSYNNEGNKIIISARGANAGFVNYETGKFWAGNSCYSVDIIEKDLNNVHFIYYYVKFKQNQFTDYQQAANIPSVSKKDAQIFKIVCPCKEEQQKIASYLSSIDNKIESVSKQIEKTQKFKKGLLQQMFV